MEARRLSEEGVSRFRNYLSESMTDGSIVPPWDLLEADDFTANISDAPDLDQEFDFENNKLTAANYLVEQFAHLSNEITTAHDGLWSWLGLFYLDQVYPIESRGNQSEGYRYSFQPDYQEVNHQTYYRHILYTPFQLVRNHGGTIGKALLAGSLTQPGGVVEEIASRQEFISNPSILSLVDSLYLGNSAPPYRVKTGASPGGRNRRPGDVRRLAEVLLQFDLTFDFYDMSAGEMLALLPNEFDRWQTN